MAAGWQHRPPATAGGAVSERALEIARRAGYVQGHADGYTQGHADAARDIFTNASAQVAALRDELEAEQLERIEAAVAYSLSHGSDGFHKV